MNNIIRFWNQNRKGIIAGIAAIVLLIVIIQVLNEMAKQRNQAQNENVITLTEEEKKLPTESIIGGDKISIEKTKSNVEKLNTFIEKCNNGDISGAYAMLTDDCKEVLFETEESFKKGYYNILFSNKRISNIENFYTAGKRYTYKVTLYDDVMATGQAQNAKSYQDYITIVENETEGKLNINGFIYKKDINKESEKDGIKIIVLSQRIYKDHETYEIKIENNTQKRILIDTREKSRSIYAMDKNNSTYSSNIYEIANSLYEIPANFERTYNIQFKKIYSTNVATSSISFSDIVPDYEVYKQNTEVMKDRVKIRVNI